MHMLPPAYHHMLKKHKAGFAPGIYESLIDAIIEADSKNADMVDDEDSLFEQILDDVLPEGADEALEGRVMMLLDDYFEIRE
ncbi:MAG: hypothetical protein ACOX6O_10895 [Christensenellales bacterium]|jgi:hypothetical protein